MAELDGKAVAKALGDLIAERDALKAELERMKQESSTAARWVAVWAARAEKAEADLAEAKREIEQIETGYQFGPCQAEGCKQAATAGTPGPDGYKWLCHEHALAYRDAKGKP